MAHQRSLGLGGRGRGCDGRPFVLLWGFTIVADWVGWRWAFAPLAVGPLVGTAAMLALRRRPEAEVLAGRRG